MNELNYEKVFNVLIEETKKYLLDNNLKAMILGISGGIDSTVTAAICHEVSKQTGIPLIGRSLPIKNKENEFSTSILVGKAFCTEFKVSPLDVSYAMVLSNIGINEYEEKEITDLYSEAEFNTQEFQTPIANGNIQARLRMIYLYNLASIHNGLVMSTDNQTEYQLGFWTLHGDVGDFDPLQDLWKTEVYKFADYLMEKYSDYEEEKMNAIKHSFDLIPTDGLGISNSDLEQIGAKSYAEVDDILQDFLAYNELFSINTKKENVHNYFDYCALYDIDPGVIKKILNRHLASEFKRKKAPIYIERSKYEN